jgi:prepilin signal peptidase PulO-like enzyme (type II secretory pathway)
MISITLSYIITSATLMLASLHLNQALERFVLNYIIPSDKQINYNKKQQLLFLMQMLLPAFFLLNLKITLLQKLFNFIFFFLLLLLARIDRHYFLLPDRLTYTVLWVSLAVSPFNITSPINSIYGACIGYSSIFIINAVYFWFQNQDGIGRGDCKLFAALGALLGWQTLPITLTLATFLALIFSTHLVLFNRNWRQVKIPFGSYLCYSGIVMLLYQLYSLNSF